tara:strand:- start:2234 stop:2788 length:555 start_codon:yes stop_codon:yes gene_type:complete
MKIHLILSESAARTRVKTKAQGADAGGSTGGSTGGKKDPVETAKRRLMTEKNRLKDVRADVTRAKAKLRDSKNASPSLKKDLQASVTKAEARYDKLQDKLKVLADAVTKAKKIKKLTEVRDNHLDIVHEARSEIRLLKQKKAKAKAPVKIKEFDDRIARSKRVLPKLVAKLEQARQNLKKARES